MNAEEPQSPGARRWPIELEQLLAHAVMAAVLAFAVPWLRRLTGPGAHECLLVFLKPVAAGMASWFAPRGAPGASVTFAIWLIVTFPADAGPTAKSLGLFFGIGVVAASLIAEVTVAAARLTARGGG